MPPQFWLRASRKAGWMRLLSGVTSEPSTVAAGVDSWISSLAATRAPTSATPANAQGMTGARTFGPTLFASWVRFGRQQSFARTWPLTPPWDFSESSKRWKAWVSACRRLSRELLMSEPRTSESASSGSGWPTPTAMDSRSAARAHYDWGRPGVTLTDAMRAWPTPSASLANDQEEPETWRARQAQLVQKGVNGNGAGLPLAIAAKEWPTPVASEAMRGSDTYMRGNQNLTGVSKGWPTPRATDGDKGGPNGRDGSGSPHLPMAAIQHFPPDPTTPMDGESTSSGTRVLNPRFVEVLMGFPIGWTAFELLGTPSSLRRPSELSRSLPSGSRRT